MSFIEEWYTNMPIITKAYMTAAVATTFAVHLDLVNVLLLYLNFGLVIDRFEVWRLVTNFFFFGQFGLGFIFHLIFFVRHSVMLEESSFRGRTADFVYLYIFCGTFLLIVDLACWWSEWFMSTPMFLGPSLAMAVVYVWARRNPHMRMNLLGFLNFNAPYLPWVIIGIESLLGQSIQWFDVVGVLIGHVYYFLEDIYPQVSGRKLIHTPWILKALLDRDEEDEVAIATEDDGPAPPAMDPLQALMEGVGPAGVPDVDDDAAVDEREQPDQ